MTILAERRYLRTECQAQTEDLSTRPAGRRPPVVYLVRRRLFADVCVKRRVVRARPLFASLVVLESFIRFFGPIASQCPMLW
jgi:hypothetical protein